MRLFFAEDSFTKNVAKSLLSHVLLLSNLLFLYRHFVTDNLPEKSDGAPTMAGRPMIIISIICIIRLELRPGSVEHLVEQNTQLNTQCSTWQDCWRATSDTVWQLGIETLDFSFRSISTCFQAKSGSEIYENENGCT